MSVATGPKATARKFSKDPLIAFYQSSIGKKLVVAGTAVLLVLYVFGHLLGNLQIYLGPDRINNYAKFLHDLGPLLWVVRIVLLAAFVTHITATIQLAHENQLANHLSHGLASMAQTLGINNRRVAGVVSIGGQTLTWLVFAGYVSIPVTTLLGIIR